MGDWKDVAIFALTGYASVSAWVVKSMWGKIDKMTEGTLDLERRLPNTYARRDDIANQLDHILTAINSLREIVERKADK